MVSCLLSTWAQEHVRSCFSHSIQIAAKEGMALTLNSSSLLCDSLTEVGRKLHVVSSSIADTSRTMRSVDHRAPAVALLRPQPGAVAEPFCCSRPCSKLAQSRCLVSSPLWWSEVWGRSCTCLEGICRTYTYKAGLSEKIQEAI